MNDVDKDEMRYDRVEHRLYQLEAHKAITEVQLNAVMENINEYKEPWYAGTLLYIQNPYTHIDSFIYDKIKELGL